VGKPQSMTLSEYQGSFEDANPHQLNNRIYSLAKLIKNHDIVNYSYSLSRDMTLAQNLTRSYISLMSNFEIMLEKVSDRIPVDHLQKMTEKTSKLAIALNGFDTVREEEFKTKLQLRLKPLSSQKSSQKNSQRLRDQLQAIAEVDDDIQDK
jgi:Mg-chelatase subunit ChlI